MKTVSDADKIWIEALKAITGSDLKPLTSSDVKNILMGIVTGGEEIPWTFYDIVSQLIEHIPLIIRDTVIKEIKCPTGYDFEHLRLTSDGYWQIVWDVNPNDLRTSEMASTEEVR